MHKAYQSRKPCANRLLQKRWDDSDYQKHLESLEKIKPSVDTTAPNTYMHMHLKPKKLQLEEERLAIIERDNRILLEKIANVMRTQGGIDNKNNYPFGSLNREKRQREILRVTLENDRIIKRVLGTEAEFNRPKLEKDWQDTLKTLDMMSHYPKDWWLQKSKTTMSPDRANTGLRRSKSMVAEKDKKKAESNSSSSSPQSSSPGDSKDEKEKEKEKEKETETETEKEKEKDESD